MAEISGKQALAELLHQEGVEYVFGNPGTTELPLMDVLAQRDDLRYILSLHEGVALAMAAGYAEASGKIGVTNFHVAPGLGNALGLIYTAYMTRTPLLVTAGQQDRRMQLEEPLLWGDLVQMVVATKPGTTVPVRIVRDRTERTVNVTVDELDLDAENSRSARNRDRDDDTGQATSTGFGLRLQNVSPQDARELKLDSARGALIADVELGSPAARAGLRPGDVIVRVGREPIASATSANTRTKPTSSMTCRT